MMLLKKIRYRLSMLSKTLLFQLGLGKHLLKNRYGERILVFHNIDLKGETKLNSRFISKDYFEELLQYFKQHYNVISLDDFYAGNFVPEKFNIAITFDDGQLNNYELAAPILEKYNMPATFFITTIHEKKEFLWADFLDLVTLQTQKRHILFEGNRYRKNRKNEFSFNGTTLKTRCKYLEYQQIMPLFEMFSDEWQTVQKANLGIYWKLMSAEHIMKLSENPLFKIGAHGKTHANLVEISGENALSELHDSKKTLEAIIQKPITDFAFPFGTYTPKLVAAAKKEGFSKLLLLDYNNTADIKDAVLRPRFVVNPYISKQLFLASLLKGTYR